MTKLLIFICAMLLSGCAVTRFTDRYDSGEVMQTGQYKKHLLDGEVLTYYENGQLWKRQYYKAGQPDGLCEYYYEDYAPEADGTFRPVGQLETRSYYEMGYRRGKEEQFHRNGQMAAERYHIPVKSVWREWDEDGNLCFEGDYADGRGHGIWTYYRPDGSISCVMQLADGNRHGTMESFYPDGRPYTREVYEQGVLVERMAWDEQGVELIEARLPEPAHQDNNPDVTMPAEPLSRQDSLQAERWKLQEKRNAAIEAGDEDKMRQAMRAVDEFDTRYEEDFLDFFITVFTEAQRDGEFYEYYATGEKKLVTPRSKGETHGVQRVLYKDGSVARSVEYKRNIEDGPVRCFYRDGTPEVEGQMTKGERTGIWRFYNPDGSVHAEVDYDKTE